LGSRASWNGFYGPAAKTETIREKSQKLGNDFIGRNDGRVNQRALGMDGLLVKRITEVGQGNQVKVVGENCRHRLGKP